jgi:hypothetical protein
MAAPERRPKAREHLVSLEVDAPTDLPARVTIVDDVVTRGAQLFGAAWRPWTARPDLDVLAFAVVRTVSDPSQFEDIFHPRCGTVTYDDENCWRHP